MELRIWLTDQEFRDFVIGKVVPRSNGAKDRLCIAFGTISFERLLAAFQIAANEMNGNFNARTAMAEAFTRLLQEEYRKT